MLKGGDVVQQWGHKPVGTIRPISRGLKGKSDFKKLNWQSWLYAAQTVTLLDQSRSTYAGKFSGGCLSYHPVRRELSL
jgi:hypothetical protein